MASPTTSATPFPTILCSPVIERYVLFLNRPRMKHRAILADRVSFALCQAQGALSVHHTRGVSPGLRGLRKPHQDGSVSRTPMNRPAFYRHATFPLIVCMQPG